MVSLLFSCRPHVLFLGNFWLLPPPFPKTLFTGLPHPVCLKDKHCHMSGCHTLHSGCVSGSWLSMWGRNWTLTITCCLLVIAFIFYLVHYPNSFHGQYNTWWNTLLSSPVQSQAFCPWTSNWGQRPANGLSGLTVCTWLSFCHAASGGWHVLRPSLSSISHSPVLWLTTSFWQEKKKKKKRPDPQQKWAAGKVKERLTEKATSELPL